MSVVCTHFLHLSSFSARPSPTSLVGNRWRISRGLRLKPTTVVGAVADGWAHNHFHDSIWQENSCLHRFFTGNHTLLALLINSCSVGLNNSCLVGLLALQRSLSTTGGDINSLENYFICIEKMQLRIVYCEAIYQTKQLEPQKPLYSATEPAHL